MDIMSTSSAHREGEDLQNYELYIKEILSEVEKINQVNTPLYDLVLTKIGFIRGKSRSQGRQQPIIATSWYQRAKNRQHEIGQDLVLERNSILEEGK